MAYHDEEDVRPPGQGGRWADAGEDSDLLEGSPPPAPEDEDKDEDETMGEGLVDDEKAWE